MMNETVYIDGIFSWCRVVNPETFTDPVSGKVERYWSVTIHPTPESLELIRDLQARGIMNKMKKNDDGYYIKFKRPTERRKRDGGLIPFEKPAVYNTDKQLIDGLKVGNGTAGTLKLEVYGGDKPRKYLAARLDSIMVKSLVEYDPNRDLSEFDRTRAEGFEDRPNPQGWD